MVVYATYKTSNGHLPAHSNRCWYAITRRRLHMLKLCIVGTLITNFVGPLRLAQEISSIYVSRLLDSHALGPQTLGCVWILAFAMLRATAEQLDFAFDVFDPIYSSQQVSGFTPCPIIGIFVNGLQLCNIPKLDDLPFILDKSNDLARIDRYLAGLEEFQSFFLSVQQMLASEPILDTGDNCPAFRSARTRKSARFEASRAREKIQQEQRLCQTYIRQYNALVQLVSRIPCPTKNPKLCLPGHFLWHNPNYRETRHGPRGRGAVWEDWHISCRTGWDRGAHEFTDRFLRHERPGTDARRHGNAVRVLGNRHSSAVSDDDLRCLYLPLDDDGIGHRT